MEPNRNHQLKIMAEKNIIMKVIEFTQPQTRKHVLFLGYRWKDFSEVKEDWMNETKESTKTLQGF